MLLPIDFWGPVVGSEVLLLLPLTLRRGKGSNADANAEAGARLTFLFVAALPLHPFLLPEGEKEVRAGEWKFCLSTSRMHWES